MEQKRQQPVVAPVASASIAGVTAFPVCGKCNDTKRAVVVDKATGLRSVGPCDCAKG